MFVLGKRRRTGKEEKKNRQESVHKNHYTKTLIRNYFIDLCYDGL